MFELNVLLTLYMEMETEIHIWWREDVQFMAYKAKNVRSLVAGIFFFSTILAWIF